MYTVGEQKPVQIHGCSGSLLANLKGIRAVEACTDVSVLTPCLLVTYSQHVKHIQLKPTELESHTALVKLPVHRGTTAERRHHHCILVA